MREEGRAAGPRAVGRAGGRACASERAWVACCAARPGLVWFGVCGGRFARIEDSWEYHPRCVRRVNLVPGS